MTYADAVRLSVLVMIAMDMHGNEPDSLAPAPDPRLAPGWQLVGYLTATDAIWRRQPGKPVCFGFLVRSIADPTRFAVAIRGTADFVEWVEDAEFDAVPHPVAGRVEAGFWGLYRSLEYRGAAALGAPETAATGLSAAVGPTGRLTVLGHSLGSALASYLAFDLAPLLPGRLSAALFASPRPGDAAFAQAFDSRVADYTLVNYSLDVVPHVPFGLDYTALPRATVITPDAGQSRICFSPNCFHHLVCYLSVLDYKMYLSVTLSPRDAEYAKCIKGPNLP